MVDFFSNSNNIQIKLNLFLLYELGDLDSGDQTILVNWYNSLTNKGNLIWNTENNLCGQTGVTCIGSNPQRVSEL